MYMRTQRALAVGVSESSYRGMCSEDAIDNMEDARDKLDEVIELLDDII